MADTHSSEISGPRFFPIGPIGRPSRYSSGAPADYYSYPPIIAPFIGRTRNRSPNTAMHNENDIAFSKRVHGWLIATAIFLGLSVLALLVSFVSETGTADYIFGGLFVLAGISAVFWMDNAKRETTIRS